MISKKKKKKAYIAHYSSNWIGIWVTCALQTYSSVRRVNCKNLFLIQEQNFLYFFFFKTPVLDLKAYLFQYF